MAQTTGLVQALIIQPRGGIEASTCCVRIGASPTNAELLVVQQRASDSSQAGSFKASMVEGLVAAQVNRREVVAEHGNNDANITSLTINP